MPITDIDIANMGLLRIGSYKILTFAERIDIDLQNMYNQARDEVLSFRPWEFALKTRAVSAAGLLNCSAKTITFVNGTPATITDSGSGFVTNGFEAGDLVLVVGSASNNREYRIETVTAGTLTLVLRDKAVAETLVNSTTLKLYLKSSFSYGFTRSYKYKKPTDYIDTFSVNGIIKYRLPGWKGEGIYLLTNEIDEYDQIIIQYVRQITDPLLFPSLFIDSLVLNLAANLAITISNNVNLRQLLLQELQIKIGSPLTQNEPESKESSADK